MSFFGRLRLYLLGVGIGIVVVYFTFRDREFDAWLPEGRVLEHLMRTTIDIDEIAACQLNCLNLDTVSLKSFLKDADVDFSKSDTRKEPCPVYHIEGLLNNSNAVIQIESCTDKARLLSISTTIDPCDC